MTALDWSAYLCSSTRSPHVTTHLPDVSSAVSLLHVPTCCVAQLPYFPHLPLAPGSRDVPSHPFFMSRTLPLVFAGFCLDSLTLLPHLCQMFCSECCVSVGLWLLSSNGLPGNSRSYPNDTTLLGDAYGGGLMPGLVWVPQAVKEQGRGLCFFLFYLLATYL